MKPWILYTAARLGFFAVALVILLAVGTGWLLGTVFAAIIALALSVVFLGKLRQQVAESIQSRVDRKPVDDDSATEDAQLDASTR